LHVVPVVSWISPLPAEPLRACVRRTLVAIAIVTPVVTGAHAQVGHDARVRDLERRLDESLRRIDSLVDRVRELESRIGTSPRPEVAVQAPTPDPKPVPAAASTITDTATTTPPAPALATPTSGPVLRGFADAGAGYAGREARRGFTVGSVDFYFTPQFGPHARGLVELVFEVDEHGELHHDLERVQLGYTLADALTLWGGRFHTPVGHWNGAFHHGQQLQTSLSRPRFIEFEDRGGILPAHLVGTWAEGSARLGHGRVTWDLFAGNNPSITANVLSPNVSGTHEPGLASGFNLGYRFGGAAEGLKLGIHGLALDVRDDAITPSRTRVRMAGAYGVLDTDTWEVIGEYYRFANRAVDAADAAATHARSSWAGFVQAGRRLARYTPYVRTEKTVLDQTDPYFSAQASGRSYDRNTLGLRFDLTSAVALKIEAGRTRRSASLPAFNEWRFQYALRF